MNGIDVSHWNGVIDFAKVKNSNIDFVIIKAGGSDAGFYKDGCFEKNYTNAKAAGLHVGAYYFVGKNCISAADGKADAIRFLLMLQGKQFDMPVYIDLESTAPKNRNGATEAVIAFCEHMESCGYYVGIYASDISGFQEKLDNSRLAAYDHWVARYHTKPTYVKNYGMWQYADDGFIAGIGYGVDLDISYKDYPTIIKTHKLNGYK